MRLELKLTAVLMLVAVTLVACSESAPRNVVAPPTTGGGPTPVAALTLQLPGGLTASEDESTYVDPMDPNKSFAISGTPNPGTTKAWFLINDHKVLAPTGSQFTLYQRTVNGVTHYDLELEQGTLYFISGRALATGTSSGSSVAGFGLGPAFAIRRKNIVYGAGATVFSLFLDNSNPQDPKVKLTVFEGKVIVAKLNADGITFDSQRDVLEGRILVCKEGDDPSIGTESGF